MLLVKSAVPSSFLMGKFPVPGSTKETLSLLISDRIKGQLHYQRRRTRVQGWGALSTILTAEKTSLINGYVVHTWR